MNTSNPDLRTSDYEITTDAVKSILNGFNKFFLLWDDVSKLANLNYWDQLAYTFLFLNTTDVSWNTIGEPLFAPRRANISLFLPERQLAKTRCQLTLTAFTDTTIQRQGKAVHCYTAALDYLVKNASELMVQQGDELFNGIMSFIEDAWKELDPVRFQVMGPPYDWP